MKNSLLLETSNLKQSFAPIDLNAAGATGERVSMAASQRIAIVISLGASLASTVSIALKQHDAASAGNSKILELTNPYFVKAGTATKFTKVDVETAEDTYDLSTTFSTVGGLVVFEVLSEDLDVNNGFSHISVDIAAAGAAKVGAAVYVLGDNRFHPAYLTEV